ncbi:hypothetical protein C2G38_2166010 [Gigaspora rosea]|uniref:Uncharacterized protein n=1 Tax=Gigaspora rosea TaxID=44941 RepID=A0A397VS63_9GLOM|nr:hypothetical protein C2G38_2166010 [Gigaspora rosea]
MIDQETQSELEKLKQDRMVPEETQKSKYLKWIISLQNWAFVDKYPVELWKEKAEKTFGLFEVQSIISLNESKKQVSSKEPEIARKKVKQAKKMFTIKNNLVHNDDEDPLNNEEDLTDDDDDDEQTDIEAAPGLKTVTRVWQLRETCVPVTVSCQSVGTLPVVLGYHLKWELSGEVQRSLTVLQKLEYWTGAEVLDVVLGDKVYQPGRRSHTGGKGPMLRNWGPRGEKP